MAEQSPDKSASQEFLDTHQYAVAGVRQYERIFGKHFVSTGGLTTTSRFARLLNLKAGQQVLDVGCGTGGSAFHMAQEYGVRVHGIDLSKNMLGIARQSAAQMKFPTRAMVTFELCDATKTDFPENSFDVIYSRDAILHIYDKLALFTNFRKWLKPGGKVFISDYCVGQQPFTEEFEKYLADRAYHLLPVHEYGKTLQHAGLVNVIAKDNSLNFIEVLSNELQEFSKEDVKKSFIEEFNEKDYKKHVEGWKAKLDRVGRGEQKWGVFYGEKPSESYVNIISRL